MGWKPELAPGVDLRKLPLSPLHGFVLSRVDGASDVTALSQVTGMPVDRVEALLDELVATGALRPRPDAVASPPHAAPATRTPGSAMTAAAPAAAQAAASAKTSPTPTRAPTTAEPPARAMTPPASVSAPGADVASTTPDSTTPEATDAAAPEAAPDDAPLAGTADDAEADDAAVPDEPEPADARQLFEATLREQPVEARVALARAAVEPQLSALCFDPLPAVAQALLENPKVGPVHARLLARHHRTALGLEALAARGHFASDGGVRRNLLQNPMLPQSVYRRLWAMRRLMEQHRVTISRDLPEATRRVAREVMRTRFASGPPEEKVELIVKTEGRCLAALVGLPLDSKSSAMLCARTYASLQFVQNLARWSAAPPQLIGHLLRQDLVKRNAMLRGLLERHPNSPKGNF